MRHAHQYQCMQQLPSSLASGLNWLYQNVQKGEGGGGGGGPKSLPAWLAVMSTAARKVCIQLNPAADLCVQISSMSSSHAHHISHAVWQCEHINRQKKQLQKSPPVGSPQWGGLAIMHTLRLLNIFPYLVDMTLEER